MHRNVGPECRNDLMTEEKAERKRRSKEPWGRDEGRGKREENKL